MAGRKGNGQRRGRGGEICWLMDDDDGWRGARVYGLDAAVKAVFCPAALVCSVPCSVPSSVLVARSDAGCGWGLMSRVSRLSVVPVWVWCYIAPSRPNEPHVQRAEVLHVPVLACVRVWAAPNARHHATRGYAMSADFWEWAAWYGDGGGNWPPPSPLVSAAVAATAFDREHEYE